MGNEYLDTELKENQQKARESFKKQVPKLKLMDDYYLMMYAQRFPEDFSMILSEFIGKTIEIVPSSFQIQEVNATPDDAKDVRFDITADTTSGGKIVLEVGSRKKFNDLRLRYYLGKIDSMLLNKGENYKDLKESNIVIVSKEDKRKRNQPRYFMRMCYVESLTEVGNSPEIVDNGQAVTFINASYHNEKDNSTLADIIHDFKCADPQKMKNKIIREHSKIIKNTQEGRDFMLGQVDTCITKLPLFGGRLLSKEEQEEYREEGREEGREEAKALYEAELTRLKNEVQKYKDLYYGLNAKAQS